MKRGCIEGNEINNDTMHIAILHKNYWTVIVIVRQP